MLCGYFFHINYLELQSNRLIKDFLQFLQIITNLLCLKIDHQSFNDTWVTKFDRLPVNGEIMGIFVFGISFFDAGPKR